MSALITRRNLLRAGTVVAGYCRRGNAAVPGAAGRSGATARWRGHATREHGGIDMPGLWATSITSSTALIPPTS